MPACVAAAAAGYRHVVMALAITALAAVLVLIAFRYVVTAPARRIVRRSDLVRPLSIPARDGFAREWWLIQAEFVDMPLAALAQADALVSRVLDARGAAAPRQLEYARRMLRGASTEELRLGLIGYRRLFAELLEQPVEQPPNVN